MAGGRGRQALALGDGGSGPGAGAGRDGGGVVECIVMAAGRASRSQAGHRRALHRVVRRQGAV